MKKRKGRLMLIVLILISCINVLPVFAAGGTVEIESEKNVKIEYAKVGNIVDGRYVLDEEYKKSGVNLNGIVYAEEMEHAANKLNSYVKMTSSLLTDEEGKAKIENLPKGVYLMRCFDKPFFVTIPMWNEKLCDYTYDITVKPKSGQVTAPQTGVYSPIKVYLVILVALFMCAAVFSYKARQEYRPYKVSGENRTKLREQVIKVSDKSPFDRKIDFEKLKTGNPDICGWIYIPGTQIDDPILIGKTDTEYLHKNFRGERSALGSVFCFSDTEKDFSDAHICLFGHNMSNQQMFGELKKYRKHQFAQEHQEVYIYTPDSVRRYQIFSIYDCEKTDNTFQHKMECGSEEYVSLLEQMQVSNTIEEIAHSDLTKSNQMITLASCSDYKETANRFTVNAVLKEKQKFGGK